MNTPHPSTPLTVPRPKIVFFDIDDTLYHKQLGQVPKSSADALRALMAQGIIVAIATGRGLGVFPPSVRTLVDELGIELFVTINGQYNCHQGRPLSQFALDDAQIEHTTQCLMRHGIGMAYMTHDEIICFGQSAPMTDALTSLDIPYQIYEGTPGQFLQAHSTSQQAVSVYQILAFFADNTLCTPLDRELLASLKTTRWHASGVDILDKDGSKARGIASVLRALNIDAKDAMAFGDGLNDLEMLQMVGFGVAMGNAHPKLKAVADWACPSIHADGIWRGLKTLGLI